MKFIIGNLKMNIISKKERDIYFSDFEKCLSGHNFKDVNFVVCPPFVYLESFVSKFSALNVSVGAQNIHFEEKGKFTGEISAPMVNGLSGKYVIIGHSDRRIKFGETDEVINKKVKIALKNNLTPIICIGETKEERDRLEIKSVISKQLKSALIDIPRTKISNIIIVYEPVWAIGSGQTPTSDEIMEVRILMQKILSETFNLKLNKMPSIIYGGSVSCENIREICIESGMQGVLVGAESLNPKNFIKIGEALENN